MFFSVLSTEGLGTEEEQEREPTQSPSARRGPPSLQSLSQVHFNQQITICLERAAIIVLGATEAEPAVVQVS